MMKKKYILISLVTRKKLMKETYGRQILSLFYDKYPLLAPQFASFYEPINKPINTVDAALEFWDWNNLPAFMCRRKTSVAGSWWINEDNSKTGGIEIKYNWNKDIDWDQLFLDLVSISESYFGYIHFFSEREIEPAAVGSAIHSFLNGTPGIHLQKGIPQLGWAHYFGEEYVKEINLPLLKKNGFDVVKLGEGYIIQITEKLSDVIDNYEYFDERRRLLKSLFRSGLFQKYEPTYSPVG